MDFDEGARSLLARATRLALSRKDGEVDVHHILASSSPAARRTDELRGRASWLEEMAQEAGPLREFPDIPFSAAAREALAYSCAMCLNSTIRETDLLRASFRHVEKTPRKALVADLLRDEPTRELLNSRGIDLVRLREDLGSLTLEECTQPTSFYDTPTGQRFVKAVSRSGSREVAGQLVVLLEFVMGRSPAAAVLEGCGVTEALLLDLLGAGGSTELEPSVADLLKDPRTRELLGSRGVDLGRLESELAAVPLQECALSSEFFETEAGKRLAQLMVSLAKADSGQLGFLLGCLVSKGPAREALESCGVSEGMLLELMVSVPEVDFSAALGPGWERFSKEGRQALSLAWNQANGPEMELEDLYQGTFVSPLAHDLGEAPAFRGAGVRPSPTLSAEVYRVIGLAFKEAGKGPVEVRHLLVALAEAGFSKLLEAGHSGGSLRQRFFPGG